MVLLIAYVMIVIASLLTVFMAIMVTLDIRRADKESHKTDSAGGVYVPPAERGYVEGARDADPVYEHIHIAQLIAQHHEKCKSLR